MQIKNLAIYKDLKTKPRIIFFETGKVNIITGESKTGKTALIDIIDYCLGSKDFNVKGSIIRNTVRWFSITVQFDSDQVFIARQNPHFLKNNTTNDIYFEVGDKIHLPSFDMLIPNSNIFALNKYISKKIGIDNNLHIPENYTRDSLEASFRHSRFFSFQPQNVIAEYKYLFFNQDESFKAQAIKDTLPYILGAIREDELIIQQKIHIKKRQLSKLIKEKKQEESLISKRSEKLSTFVDEAKKSELLNKDYTYESDDEAIAILNKITNFESLHEEIYDLAENEILSNLIDKRNKFKKKLSEIHTEIKAVSEYLTNGNSFSDQASSQKDRLISIGLYKNPSNRSYWNSVIGEEVDYLPPTIEQINKSLEELSKNLLYTENHRPRVQKIILELEEKKSLCIEEISKLTKTINNIYKEDKELEKYKNINILKGRAIGRISLFLETLEILNESSPPNNQIEILSNEIEDLEQLISNEEKENKSNSILNKINILMTSWRNKLDWEYQNSNLRFDLKKLTVFAETDDKSDSLQEMGSGENWLACHLIVHLALHKHFIDKKRPVANFIIFDQPTQIHYPKNYQEKNGVIVKSSDEEADEKMFDFIFDVVEELYPNLQVIVTDHANFDNERFQKSIVEEWRHGTKLVPHEWLK